MNIIKILIQGIVLVALFLGTWLGLQRIDWTHKMHLDKASDKTEEKLGDVFWDAYKNYEQLVSRPAILRPVDTMVNVICAANKIDRKTIKLHILESEEVNAFALPNGHLVVYTGLLRAADRPEEVCGVLGHEIAHIQLHHVMKKLVKEVGLSALVAMTTGRGGGELARQTAKTLSSSAFDRSLEKEADIKSADYMVEAGIDPVALADFLYKLSAEEGPGGEYLSWISTHPDSKERGEYLVEYCKGKEVETKPVIAAETWKKLKEKVKGEEAED
ncbi:MAG: M48 family metallopeptidase [Chitinophagales bacterium]